MIISANERRFIDLQEVQHNWSLRSIFFSVFVKLNLFAFCLFDLLLYVHSKQLRSCLDGQLLITTLFLGKPTRGSQLISSAHSFASN